MLGREWTTLDAINVGKVLSVALLAAAIFMHGGLHNMRQVRFPPHRQRWRSN